MKVIVGLGNPGDKYKNSRHNVGFMALDAISNNEDFGYSEKFKSEMLQLKDNLLIKPQTFMNESGIAVSKLLDFYKVDLDDLVVIHDDLDLALGEYKIQKGVGPKLHYGVSSIEEDLKSPNFWRVRVGVDNRDPNNRIAGEEYVLADFERHEFDKIREVITKICHEERLH